MKTQLLCPVCKGKLSLSGASLICPKKHVFDIAKEGYVNLAVGKSGSGDGKEMCVARRDFLEAGYYLLFADAAACAVKEYTPDHSVCDAGCGNGYYLRRVRNLLGEGTYIGLDLAKDSVKFAAKAEKNSAFRIDYAVAGIFDMPLCDASFGTVLSVFAPVPYAEASRILVDGGILLVAHPGEKHLDGLKRTVYDSPYDNIEKQLSYPGFRLIDEIRSKYTVGIKKEDIKNLMLMTPYYWKTSKEDIARLLSSDGFETQLDFIISVFTKE